MAERKTQAERSKAARAHIVQAALAVFQLKGYSASSMDDVRLAAGCSKGGLYHHFPAKEELLAAVVDTLAEAGRLMPPAAGADGAGAEPIGRVLIEIWAEASRDGRLRERLRRGYEALLADSMASGAALGDILRIGTMIQLLTRGEHLDADEAARRLGIERAA